jgi:hypothetical protein
MSRARSDFNFHPQIYRRDGETVTLQPGKYRHWTRGPEYLVSAARLPYRPPQHSEAST